MGRRWGALVFSASWALATLSCRAPTEITVALSADFACADLRGTAIIVGQLHEIETKPSALVTTVCNDVRTDTNVGSVVLVPSGSKSDEVAFKVVAGFGRPVDDCLKSFGPGCMVARRALRYLPHTRLLVPVLLSSDCNGVLCGETETCSHGQCAPAEIDPSACAVPGGCPEVSDGGSVVDATLADASSPDAPYDAADGPCPSLPGPALVPIGTGCIDSTEVTVDQYGAFLLAKAGDTSGQASNCAWNTALVPGTWPPAGPSSAPVANVNWCQASFYCQWTGKRLCGTADGGSADPNMANDPSQSLWFRACSHNGDGLHAYPYGNTYEPAACNGADDEAGVPLPSRTTCEGSYPGVLDMSGNVKEWEDRCFPGDTGPANEWCLFRGGGFANVPGDLRCDSAWLGPRAGGWDDVGFRCCTL